MKLIKNRYIYLAFLFVILMILFITYVYLLFIQIETEISQRPHWIDPSLDKVMDKKQNVSVMFKFLHILLGICVPIFDNNTELFCNWSHLEKHLDDIVNLIKEKGIKIDHIIGIKSGGAIITKYVAEKLNVNYSYIKVQNKEYNCNKNESDTIKEIIKRYLGLKREYMVCETIDVDLTGKNVLILDEQIAKGITMETVINYLVNEKHVAKTYPTTILNQKKSKYDFDLLYVSNTRYYIWPWGYDN
jgi:hypoxanthine phosphoribosyltransferase